MAENQQLTICEENPEFSDVFNNIIQVNKLHMVVFGLTFAYIIKKCYR